MIVKAVGKSSLNMPNFRWIVLGEGLLNHSNYLDKHEEDVLS